MTEQDRARLERAMQHPVCAVALEREAVDYSTPALLLGLFYLAVPLFFFVPVLLLTGGGFDAVMFFGMGGVYVVWAVPFFIVTLRLRHLRTLPARNLVGLIGGTADRRPGTWVRLERLEGEAVELRLRMKAYFEATGGALAPGTIGVARCRGDQLMEWVRIPDEEPEVERVGGDEGEAPAN